MKVLICKNHREVACKAARKFADLVKKKRDCVLGLATGSTMVPFYRKLVRISRKEKIDYSDVKTFSLDEYVGIAKTNKSSYAYYMNKHFFNKVNLKKKNTHLPGKNVKKYSKMIKKAGGIDLQVLGIGVNGHIGFNEPGSKLNSKTRKIKLSRITMRINARFFSSIASEPQFAYTMGVSDILKAREILLLANGKKKADAIKKSVEGKISSETPASFLRKHKNCTFIIDKKAASKLAKKNF